MCSSGTRAAALAAQLAALTGLAARTEETPDHIRVEVDLPGLLTNSNRLSLLATLANADRYGHDVTEQGAFVWAEIRQPGEPI